MRQRIRQTIDLQGVHGTASAMCCLSVGRSLQPPGKAGVKYSASNLSWQAEMHPS